MPHSRLVVVSFVVLALAAAVPLAAEEPPLVTDRPDTTESAVAVPPGRVQVELGAVVADEGDLDASTVGATLVRLGLTERVELRVGWDGYLSLDGPGVDDGGAGDASVGFKAVLARERGRRPQAALIVATTLPVGADGVSRERADPVALAAFGTTLSERFSLGTNVGVGWRSRRDESGERDTLSDALRSASLGYAAWERGGLFVEAFGRTGLSDDAGARTSLDAGVVWLVRPNVQLDASAGLGLSDAAPDWFVGAGVSFRLPG